jgi:hypothetical protein
MTVNSSTAASNLPTVTALSVTSGPVNTSTPLTVTGTGFVSGATLVNLVSTTASQNLILPGTSITVNSATSLSVTAPPATTATSYYVEVTTPYGTSTVQPGVSPTFTYQSVVPQVTGVSSPSGAQGSAAGGSAITITGTGFLDNVAGDSTTVNFVDVNNTSVVVQSTYARVSAYSNGTQTITAVTPAITNADTTYYVTVTTAPGGTSAVNAAYEWTFTPLTPVVSGVSPATGTAGTVLTITGIGFVSGQTTVQLVPTTGGSCYGWYCGPAPQTLNATNVSVQSSTQLTATVPSGGSSGTSYYVEVTTTAGGSSGSNGAPTFTD